MKRRKPTAPICAELPAACPICKGPLTFLTDTSPVTMRASMRSVSEDIRQVSETACGMAANGPNLLTARKSCHKSPGGATLAPKRPIVFPPSSARSEEHTSELQSLMRHSYAVFCLKKKH